MNNIAIFVVNHYTMIIVEIIRVCANEIYHMKSLNDIVTSSTSYRNDAAVVMQINLTELKSEINASQSLKKVLIIIIMY